MGLRILTVFFCKECQVAYNCAVDGVKLNCTDCDGSSICELVGEDNFIRNERFLCKKCEVNHGDDD